VLPMQSRTHGHLFCRPCSQTTHQIYGQQCWAGRSRAEMQGGNAEWPAGRLQRTLMLIPTGTGVITGQQPPVTSQFCIAASMEWGRCRMPCDAGRLFLFTCGLVPQWASQRAFGSTPPPACHASGASLTAALVAGGSFPSAADAP
jgi:hypothetical protein